ncbi:hypothetical protein GJ688_10425 [Heliobacillus mobilis]|uniref:Uncharacterized protein n=1 Tax=Heliobacterium mobile TaxID=28064 RepID=A0A6I3SKH0_HELMO|nr:hypothetical protein [Heliobacterium mobile]MTV49393.1 hypothetical protein [Heliobacterium mobile]
MDFNKCTLIKVLSSFVLPLCFTCLIPSAAFSSSLNLEWKAEFGGKKVETGTVTIPAVDGGFLLVGEAESEYLKGNGKKDIYVVKMNATGLETWEKYYGGYGDDIGTFVRATSDGGYIIGGSSRSNWNDNRNMLLVKISAEGKLQWKKEYPAEPNLTSEGLNDDEIIYIREEADGYTILGNKKSTDTIGGDIFLIKVNGQGGVEWRKTIGGREDEKAVSLQDTPDGGYLIVGYGALSSETGYDIYLSKTDSHGKVEWSKSLGGKGWDISTVTAPTSDGGYLIGGQSSSGNDGLFSGYLAKVNSEGNLLWQQVMPAYVCTLIETIVPTDKGIELTGWLESGTGYDFVRILTDETGVISSTDLINNEQWSKPFAVTAVDKGAYIVTGYVVDKPGYRYWLNKQEQAYVAKIKFAK